MRIITLPMNGEKSDSTELNLNGKYQIVMELYYVDGFSTKEIARMLHITEVNVRSRMVRGRKQLEQILTVRAMD